MAAPDLDLRAVPFGALLDALADLLAAKVAERLSAPAATRYADGKCNPLGSRRAFLDAARRGDFASFKRGREVVARWEDVVAHIERRPRGVRVAHAHRDEADDDRAALAAAGVRLRGRGRAGDPPQSHSRRR